jgi:DNA-binding GntR family transcriptional regulator
MEQIRGLGARENTSIIHDTLRTEILDGRMEAGSVISQVKVAEALGVSRGPVREALRMLQREGLIEAATNQRARVASFSVDDLEGLYALRIVNEALGIRSSVPLFSDAELAQMNELLDEMEQIRRSGRVEEWEVPHERFHRLLISHSGVRMGSTLRQLADHAARYRRLYITAMPRAWSVGRAEHEEIVAACEARDEALAAKLLARHFASTALSVIALRAPEHEPRQVRMALQLVLGRDG